MSKKNVIIIGAAGRDFHNFNTYYRDNEAYNVVAFTAAQIPDIEGRKYPAELAGSLYPDGIPIHAEEDLSKLIKDLDVDDCVFSYSDVPYQHVMSVGALVNAAGANFVMLGPGDTQIKSTKPVISVGAVRTGCGKSQKRALRSWPSDTPCPTATLRPRKCSVSQRFPTWKSTTVPSKRWKSTSRTSYAAM